MQGGSLGKAGHNANMLPSNRSQLIVNPTTSEFVEIQLIAISFVIAGSLHPLHHISHVHLAISQSLYGARAETSLKLEQNILT
jgi:hypothetical protein